MTASMYHTHNGADDEPLSHQDHHYSNSYWVGGHSSFSSFFFFPSSIYFIFSFRRDLLVVVVVCTIWPGINLYTMGWWPLSLSQQEEEEEEAAGCKIKNARDTQWTRVCVTITKHPLKNTRTWPRCVCLCLCWGGLTDPDCHDTKQKEEKKRANGQ